MPKNKLILLLTSTFIVFLFNISGAIVMKTSGKFQDYIAFNLILNTVLIIVNHNEEKRKLIIYLAVVSVITFLSEFVGVSTGIFFGDYYYTNRLGSKLFEVPIFIGFFYFTLIYSVANIIGLMTNVLKKQKKINLGYQSTFIHVLVISLIVTLMDYFFIEKTAKMLNWWMWLENNQSPPNSNYYTWFFVCLIIAFIYKYFRFSANNYFAWSIILSMLTYFSIILYS